MISTRTGTGLLTLVSTLALLNGCSSETTLDQARDTFGNLSQVHTDHSHDTTSNSTSDNQHDHPSHDHQHDHTAVIQPDTLHDEASHCEHVHHWQWDHSLDHDAWEHEHHGVSWTQADAHNWSWNQQGTAKWPWGLSWEHIWSDNWNWTWQWYQHSHCDPLKLTLEQLGERLFNDTNLSEPGGQSCATCHQRQVAFTDNRQWFPTSLGAGGETFGKRNTPTGMYASFIPPLGTTQRFNPITQTSTDVPFGGLFVDGRVSTLEEQAKVPFLSSVEMALSSAEELRDRIRVSSYANGFKAQFGNNIFDNADDTLNAAARAIAAFERTDVFSPFASRFDRVQAGTDSFTETEARGFALFNGRANCSACHKSPEGIPELFSDLQYHNVGTPRNFDLLNKIGDSDFIDRGHGAVTGNPADDGLFRTPTLRNVAVTAPYMHNGALKSLREVVVFYNTRETGFGAEPEVRNANIPPTFLIGDLGLSDQDIDDIVAFLKTLTDR